MLLCCVSLSSSREYNASSRSSKKNFWHHCRGGLRKSHIPSTYHKPLSFTLHFLPLVFLSPTSPLPFYLPFFCRVPIVRLLLVCLCVACLLVTMALPISVDPHLKRLEEIENNVRHFMTIQFEHNYFFRNGLKEQIFYGIYE